MASLQLHKDALAISVDAERMQLRVPNGQHLTFDEHSVQLFQAFELLRSGTAQPALDAILGAELAAELITLLDSRGLVDANDQRSQFQRLLDQHLTTGGRVVDATPPRAAALVGEGRIATLVRNAIGGASCNHAGASVIETLLVAMSDTDNLDEMLMINQRAIQENRPVTFIRWDQRRLIVGPFVVPGETACLDCAAHRQRAASIHIDELIAWRRAGSVHPPFEGGEILDNFVMVVAMRHISAIMAGAHAIARPGAVTMVDPVTLEIVTAPVLRLPRCPSCRPGNDRPQRSIRDLN